MPFSLTGLLVDAAQRPASRQRVKVGAVAQRAQRPAARRQAEVRSSRFVLHYVIEQTALAVEVVSCVYKTMICQDKLGTYMNES